MNKLSQGQQADTKQYFCQFEGKYTHALTSQTRKKPEIKWELSLKEETVEENKERFSHKNYLWF